MPDPSYAVVYTEDGYRLLRVREARRRASLGKGEVISVHDCKADGKVSLWELTHPADCPCRAGLTCDHPDDPAPHGSEWESGWECEGDASNDTPWPDSQTTGFLG
jgi:hypothetical protein